MVCVFICIHKISILALKCFLHFRVFILQINVHILKIFIIHTFYALNVLFEVFFNGEIKFEYYLSGGEKS